MTIDLKAINASRFAPGDENGVGNMHSTHFGMVGITANQV